MSIQQVLKHPNKKLREKSRLVTDAELQSEDFQNLINDMLETMKTENGVGLAAPQVGKNIRLIIVETKKGPEAFINPKIVSSSKKMIPSQEGCLSIPGILGMVQRHKSVKVRAKNRDGEKVSMKVDALQSIIFQHEIDHLDGILFIDKAFEITESTPETESKLI